MKPALNKILRGKVVIVGIGNVMRRDDGFGPALIKSIKDKVNAVCIDAGVAPENYLGKITKTNPDTILLVDAMHMERPAGEYDIFKKEDILKGGFTTHNMSPDMLIEYLQAQTKADIYMLGIQPKHMFFGEEMSPVLEKMLDEISNAILNTLGVRSCTSHT